MNYDHYDVVIAGSGLAALAAAARLLEKGIRKIGVFAPAFGGTPYIAAINFVLPDNPSGDTPARYFDDMLAAGYGLNDRSLVGAMTAKSAEGYELLSRWGVEFARKQDGTLLRRHASGSSCPRSLCRTTELIGVHIERTLKPRLEAEGVEFHLGMEAVGIVKEGDRAIGLELKGEDGALRYAYAPIVIAAWGGVGTLLGRSTYPSDVNGRTLGIAFDAGVKLADLEFLEYEPLVVLNPPGAVGEPCPTAMLGEGAHLLNTDGERFLLAERPQGEAGAPKSFINKMIWKEVAAGRGTGRGGVLVDLRHIDRNILKAYPWFFDRLQACGVDPNLQLVEVGPVPHSYSGGIRVDSGCRSSLKGLYAVGEAAAGFHGACRMAGNAASQAVLSGMLCAEAAAADRVDPVSTVAPDSSYAEDLEARRLAAEAIAKAAPALGIFRNGGDLREALAGLEGLLDGEELRKDTCARQSVFAVSLMLRAAIERKESRGTHLRTDFPETNPKLQNSITLARGAGNDVLIGRDD
jgi:aspartate oxidase